MPSSNSSPAFHLVVDTRNSALPAASPNYRKYLLLVLLALGGGFVVYSFSNLYRLSHGRIHLSDFYKPETTTDRHAHGTNLQDTLKQQASAVDGSQTISYPQPAGAPIELTTDTIEKEAEIQKLVSETARILSTRVCGSPAIDGYTHVDPSCLEGSPTYRWYQAYYAAGGKQGALVAHMETAADYDGLAVKWGLKNTVKSAQECAEQCKRHLPGQVQGPFQALPCNAFAYCPDPVCFEPDAHHHTKGDCWLKFTEGPASPEVNMRGDLPPDYRARHGNAPARVQWISGVLLPPGIQPTNGTWGPRWSW